MNRRIGAMPPDLTEVGLAVPEPSAPFASMLRLSPRSPQAVKAVEITIREAMMHRESKGACTQVAEGSANRRLLVSSGQYCTREFSIGISDSICTLNRNTPGASFTVCARHRDQFPTQGVEVLLGSTRFQHHPTDSGHCTLKHGSHKLWIGSERVARSRQHPDDRPIESGSHLLRNLCSVHVGAYSVESDTRPRIPHFGLKE